MIKKYLVVAIVAIIITVVPTMVLAQTDIVDNNVTGEVSTDGVVITPASSFYFLKRALENVGTFFTFGKDNKAERHLELAERRLAEAKKLSEEGSDKATEAIDLYEKEVDDLNNRLKDIDNEDIINKVTEATNRHINTLEGVLGRVSENARETIQERIAVAKERQEMLINRIEKRIKNRIENKNEKKENFGNNGNSTDTNSLNSPGMRIRSGTIATNTMLINPNINPSVFQSLERAIKHPKTPTQTMRAPIGMYEDRGDLIGNTSTGTDFFESIMGVMGLPQKHKANTIR